MELLPGAESWSHMSSGGRGALCLHGFTGNPNSMRGVAGAFAEAGFHVELPRLPGHGTTIEDMLTTGWADWTGEVEAAYRRLSERAEHIVVCGLSMGGSLTLHAALNHPEVRGIVCVNPAVHSQPDEVLDMVRGMMEEGTIVMPGIGSDIADPDVTEEAYEGTPLPPLLSLMAGLAGQSGRYGELMMPLLLITSEQDHVVEPEQSRTLADAYGGYVDHVWLTRSFHVATLDYDAPDIRERAVAFGEKVCS